MSKLLSELLALHEAPSVPIELKKIFAPGVSDSFAKKAIEKLWGGERLMWHGERFFGGGKTLYDKAQEACEAYINDGMEVDVNIPFDANNVNPDALHDDGEVDFQATIDDQQECYLGYNPKTDKLFMGFDAWIGDEELHEAFDKAFERATDEEFDSENEEHSKVWNDVWRTWQDQKIGFMGLIFEITDNNGELTVEEAMAPMHGGFYQGTYKIFKGQNKSVVDLRLD